jgi:hypothetical protein
MPNLQHYCADYIDYNDSIIHCDYCHKQICNDCLPDDFYDKEYEHYKKGIIEHNKEYMNNIFIRMFY